MTQSSQTAHRPPGQTLGFTLLEVLIAVAVLAIAMVSILHTNIQVQDALLSGQEKTTLSLLTSNLLADIQAEGLDQRNQYSGDFPDHPHYRWTLNIEPTRNEALNALVIHIADADGQDPVFTHQEYVLAPAP